MILLSKLFFFFKFFFYLNKIQIIKTNAGWSNTTHLYIFVIYIVKHRNKISKMETFSFEHKVIHSCFNSVFKKDGSMVAYNRVECCFLDTKNIRTNGTRRTLFSRRYVVYHSIRKCISVHTETKPFNLFRMV